MTSKYRTAPIPTTAMPKGIPYIIGNEAAERFSYYGMKGILIIFMTQYLIFMKGSLPGSEMSDAEATANVHLFNSAVYFFPIFGALLSDIVLGKYLTILLLSMVYCLGHAALAIMGVQGVPLNWMLAGLVLIAIGSGGIKPCVSAHVGDQFGQTNSHLLTRVFGWFYFAINTGAFLSTLLTPWLLEWYGPHWAFGIPGVLMGIATIAFWMGRKVFIHVPPGGVQAFFGETFSREGLSAIWKLMVIYVFVAVFWALFDQMGSSWVLQAEDMDRHWLGITWLSSQIQAVNPILILVFIPLFQFVVYPVINAVFPLTPMRKISIGLFVMVGAFAIVSVAQEIIDSGGRPSIGWQVMAYGLLTAAEVMVSITCLEFSYTQAPRKMKSVIMALFLMSVSLGNFFTAAVNNYIIVPEGTAPATDLMHSLSRRSQGGDIEPGFFHASAAEAGLESDKTPEGHFLLKLSGPGGNFESESAVEILYSTDGKQLDIHTSENQQLNVALVEIEKHWDAHQALPLDAQGTKLIEALQDVRGNPYRYDLINSKLFLISSSGPDGEHLTADDLNLSVTRIAKTEEEIAMEANSGGDLTSAFHPTEPWLARRKAEMAADNNTGTDVVDDSDNEAKSFTTQMSVGGGQNLAGAAYFWFFAQLMLGTACLFVVVAWLYKPREYLQVEAAD
ncbi:MAG: POT family MFS transporter [Pirellulales bacterium]|jgi:POT family proton-dependent oligopeptide transporter|nr:POT family MFS transporter [Pirellulales bacterium]